ncbi:S4 domain-containing protein [Candidatus Vidania fulgoroideorum]
MKIIKKINNKLCLFSRSVNINNKINYRLNKKNFFKKKSDYKNNNISNKKIRLFYGIKKKQFKNIIKKKKINIERTTYNLIFFFEKRIDAFLYTIGFASTIREAKQIISHGFVLLNGKNINLPGILLKTNDFIEIKEKYKKSFRIINAVSCYIKNKKKNLCHVIDYYEKKAIYKRYEFDKNHILLIDEI